MFNLFKSKKNVQQTIEAIHNEFDNAGERLLAEAKDILSGAVLDEKGERLKKLGFIQAKAAAKNTELARRNAEIEENNRKRKDGAKWVQYYSTYYPNNKFITEEIVKEICNKYNLYCGPVSWYKGDVPLKNVAEMEGFNLRQEDMHCYTALDQYARFESQRSYMNMIGNGLLGAVQSARSRLYNEVRRTPLSLDEMEKLESEKHYSKEEFKICAPEKDFDISRMTKKGRFLIPDPIVLQPVKGGFLIVSKWGLEANDELVINEKQN